MRLGALCVGALTLLLASLSEARPVYVCELPGGSLEVTHFPLGADPLEAVRQLRTRRAAMPSEASCLWTEDSVLPARERVDPRDPTGHLTQRHRWRVAGGRVVVDRTIQRPHGEQVQREVLRLFSPARRAVLLATPLGSNLFQAFREREWVMAKALLDLAASRVGQAGEVLTAQELVAVRAVGADYETDLGG